MRCPVLLAALIVLATTAGSASANEWAEPERVAEVEAGERAEARVTWWGFDPEDSTQYLQEAIDSPASKLTVPDVGEPWVVEPILIERDDLELHFEPGVVVQAKRGSFRGRGDCLFLVRDCENIIFRGYGATFRMWKQDYWEDPYRHSGWRHTLSLRGARDVQVLGLTLRESGGDGIYVGRGPDDSYCQNIVIRDVISDGNHRQGLSIVSVDDILVENSRFMNTLGTGPMAGIDAETHRPQERLSNVVIRGCAFIDNAQIGMHNFPSQQTAESAPVSILWENNYVRGGEVGIHVASIDPETPSGEIIFRDNLIEDTHHAGILIRGIAAESGIEIRFENNVLRNTARRGPYDQRTVDFFNRYHEFRDTEARFISPAQWWRPHFPSGPIVFNATGGGPPAVQGGVHFDNNLVIHDRDEPIVRLTSLRGRRQHVPGDEPPDPDAFETWTDISGIIRVINPHGARIEKETDVTNFTLEIEEGQP